MPNSSAAVVVEPGMFEPTSHYYPRVLNAQIHPLVRAFLGLGNERIAKRYAHMHPEVRPGAVDALLTTQARWFLWGGADLFCATTQHGVRHLVVIETNSCPSGQKSMPRLDELDEEAGYRHLLQRAFVPMLRRRGLPKGGLAVLFDKNPMEASGYAATLADIMREPVLLTPCFDEPAEARATRFTDDGVLEVKTPDGHWHPIRAALRYVTQRPWNRIPPLTRTAIFNPVLACLAGGRNKMLAAKAYDFRNAELRASGLRIRAPETFWDIPQSEVPLWVQRMGGVAVVKNPYSNAGQGVYTITSEAELDRFMALEPDYDRFIVQALIGNYEWSSDGTAGRYYHVGTVPDRRGRIFVADLRMMVGSSPEGFFPVAIYARRARKPLADQLSSDVDSWSMLGTNLSVRDADGGWLTESERLLLMDSRDFNRVGIGLDDMIEAYIQTVMAVTAIDTMAVRLVTQRGRFRRKFFGTVNPDGALAAEICG